jgi:hypothetical protein
MHKIQTMGDAVFTVNKMNGFDAYENAWDIISKSIWNAIGFNLTWFAGSLGGIFFLLAVTVTILNSWTLFYLLTLFLSLVFAPLWEGANILRYGNNKKIGNSPSSLPVLRIILARLLFLLCVVPAYFLFILPGIYLNCRFSLYLPLLILSPKLSPIASLAKSWSITRSRFVDLYSLWIVIVVSKPICLLSFGLGFFLERPISGLAKYLLYSSCADRSYNGSDL